MLTSFPVRWLASRVSALGGSLKKVTNAIYLSASLSAVRRFAVTGIVASCGLVASLVFLLASLVAPGEAYAGSRPLAAGSPKAVGSVNPSDRLVFDSDRTGNFEIYSMHGDGTNLRQLTFDTRYDSWWARVSPNHQDVVFYRTPKGVHDLDYSQTALWMMKIDGSAPRLLRPAGKDGWILQGHADWSPDGATILFSGCPRASCFQRDLEIYAISATGGRARRLTSNTIADNDPCFSPNGMYIAWLAETGPSAYGVVSGYDIMLMQADGSNKVNLTNDQQLTSMPHWAPDGMRIYTHRWVVGVSTHWSLWALNFDGSGLTQITSGVEGNDVHPHSH